MMAVAQTLAQQNRRDFDLYLFDTFEGMVKPSNVDVDYAGRLASKSFQSKQISDNSSDWCTASIEEVQLNLQKTGYDLSKVHLIKGKVEDTIPSSAPTTIAMLRLDTDWYESTLHELTYLYPRLSSGGVLIIDDYGHWQGCRRAVDEYFAHNGIYLLLNRIDYTGRIAIKP